MPDFSQFFSSSPFGSWGGQGQAQPPAQPQQQAMPPGVLDAIRRMLGIDESAASIQPNTAGKVPSPDFTVPPEGLRPRPSDAFVPNLGAAKSIAAGAVEPFGQLGRVMTGQSQDVPMDVLGAAAGLAPIGPPGKGAALKAGAEAAARRLPELTEAAASKFGNLHLLSKIAEHGPDYQNVPVIDHTGKVIHNPINSEHVNGPMLMMDKEGNLSPGILAYHGSPHDFDRFDLGKIGTGEGAQAYGHGLYFAENEGVAKSYKGTVPNGLGPLNIRNLWTPAELPSGKGHMYQVSIKAPPEHFLDWDKPLSEQHQKVQEAIGNNFLLPTKPTDTGQQIYDSFMSYGRGSAPHEEASANITKRLREAGIPGIKYLDQGSRGKGDGTRNYVVFDDKLIDIMKKYGIAGIGALPAMNAYHYQDKGN